VPGQNLPGHFKVKPEVLCLLALRICQSSADIRRHFFSLRIISDKGLQSRKAYLGFSGRMIQVALTTYAHRRMP